MSVEICNHREMGIRGIHTYIQTDNLLPTSPTRLCYFYTYPKVYQSSILAKGSNGNLSLTQIVIQSIRMSNIWETSPPRYHFFPNYLTRLSRNIIIVLMDSLTYFPPLGINISKTESRSIARNSINEKSKALCYLFQSTRLRAFKQFIKNWFYI